MNRCPFCVTKWVDRACAVAGVRLTGLERRRVIAALFSRQHLILSGPAGTGKWRLAHALALSITQGRQSRVCLLQGHPWWAVKTGNVGRFVELQMKYSVWRLAYFMESIARGGPAPQMRAGGDLDEYVVCVKRMSPVEVELYYGVVFDWLVRNTWGGVGMVPIRLIGTYDSDTPPELDDWILRTTVVVHLNGVQQEVISG